MESAQIPPSTMPIFPDENEQECIENFCQEYFEQLSKSAQARQRKASLKKQRDEMNQQLFDYMQRSKLTSVPLTVDGEQRFLRMMTSYGKHQVNNETLEKAFESITPALLEECFARLYRKHNRSPTVLEMITDVVCEATKRAYTYEKKYVDITKSESRSTRRGPVHNLDADMRQKTLDFYRVMNELRESSQEVRGANQVLRSMSKTQPTAESKRRRSSPVRGETERIGHFLEKASDATFELHWQSAPGVTTPYLLRKRQTVHVPQLTVSKLRELTSQVTQHYFEESQADINATYKQELSGDLLDDQFLGALKESLCRAVVQQREQSKEIKESIALCKHIGKRRQAEDFEVNVLDEFPAEDEDDELEED